MKIVKPLKKYKETNRIKEVLETDVCYEILFIDGSCYGLDKKYNIVPKIGDECTIHTVEHLFGTVRGFDLNGKKVFWNTDEEIENARLQYLKDSEEQRQKDFIEDKPVLDKQYSELPKCFQDRIDNFRKNNKDFRVKYEKYEMFCCTQAVEIAKACKTPKGVQKFKEMDWEKQLKKVPKLDDGHSGNTFGASCYLAYWYLEKPENVSIINGALSNLVGAKEYGEIAEKEKDSKK